MELREVKRNMNRTVIYGGAPYRLTAIIYRRRESDGTEYYQAELQDTKNGNSVVICALEQIEREVTP